MTRPKYPNSLKHMTIVTIIVIVFISVMIGSCLWTYSINTILELADRPERISTFHGILISVIPHIGLASIPVSIIVYIVDSVIANKEKQNKEVEVG